MITSSARASSTSEEISVGSQVTEKRLSKISGNQRMCNGSVDCVRILLDRFHSPVGLCHSPSNRGISISSGTM